MRDACESNRNWKKKSKCCHEKYLKVSRNVTLLFVSSCHFEIKVDIMVLNMVLVKVIRTYCTGRGTSAIRKRQ